MALIVSGVVDSVSTEAEIRRLFGHALKNDLTTGLGEDPAGSSSQTTYAFRMAMPEENAATVFRTENVAILTQRPKQPL